MVFGSENPQKLVMPREFSNLTLTIYCCSQHQPPTMSAQGPKDLEHLLIAEFAAISSKQHALYHTPRLSTRNNAYCPCAKIYVRSLPKHRRRNAVNT